MSSEGKDGGADMKGALLGMGNPLLDMSAVVPMELLEKYGVTLNNAILAEEKHLPLYAELPKEHKVELIAGGATQNSIRVAQWIAQKEGFASYIGCVGKDDFGAQLRKAAEGDGVAVHYLEDEAAPTGTCAVLVHKHERSLVTNLAAANNYKIEHLQSEPIKAVVQQARVYYSSGFFLTVSVPSMIEVGKHAAETGKVYCINLAAPFIPQFFKDPMAEVMPYCDVVFGNESEAAAYAEANGFAGATVPEVAVKIAKLPKASGLRGRLVVLTQGAGNTVVCMGGKLTEYPVAPIPEAEMVDVNGAGDAFVGGFLAKYIEGADIAECVRCGHWAAGYIIRRSGTKLEDKPSYE